MKSNRLLSQQFAGGNTLDGTRIEHALQDLAAKFNAVPADLVGRRWSPSQMVWGLTPSLRSDPVLLQWLDGINDTSLPGAATLQPPTSFQNVQRVKSCGLDSVGEMSDFGQQCMEVTFATAEPTIIGSMAVLAEVQADYPNDWTYGVAPPPGHIAGEFTNDFTLQVTVADAWDLENRKKLRQESLLYRLPSNAFLFSAAAIPADTGLPAHPLGLMFNGRALLPSPLVLVPAGSRVVLQWTLPAYAFPDRASWPPAAAQGNVWSLCAQVWRATR